MKNNLFGKSDGAYDAFDEFMLFPFFSSGEPAERILKPILGDEVKIVAVRSIILDHVAGKMTSAVGVECKGKDQTYYITIKRIGRDDKREIVDSVLSYLTILLEKRLEEDDSIIPVLMVISDKEVKNDVLVTREYICKDRIKELLYIRLLPNSKAKGELKDMVDELNRGQKGEVVSPYYRSVVDMLNSEIGMNKYKTYWNSLEHRWRINLCEEMIHSGMNDEEVFQIMEVAEEEKKDVYFFTKLKQHFFYENRGEIKD